MRTATGILENFVCLSTINALDQVTSLGVLLYGISLTFKECSYMTHGFLCIYLRQPRFRACPGTNARGTTETSMFQISFRFGQTAN